MRKSQKNQIIDTIGLLDRAHDTIKKAVETGNRETALMLLEQCQDGAIQIGNLIEASEGADFPAIGMLENYCEQVYQAYELIQQQQPLNIGKICKNFRKELIRIENRVKNDIYVRKAVVFLPYKASMWDSLESVWKAADADPECDAYVIAIPYFDKNPDGSFREIHYEGDLYPKDVPIVSWEAYDLAAEHPDEIYIHNPYDECNHVTSVHPHFYSRNLRNCTDKLVYIPYFVLNEIEPDNQTAVDGMKHFCFTPGTIYAHQVILQSENMRQIYINEYIKAAKEMGLGGEHIDRKFLEKKFLGTGSPKFDKLTNTKKGDLEIPADWLKIIEKPDGSWKRIIFYNTSVNALLKHDEQMLCKMNAVFAVFKESKDEIVLLWRPHPLIQATIESMRPQLWEEYRKIKDRYIAEGWGIYDDSADMDRAVVLSDAYYGDRSSLVQLYQKLGKPILIQDVDMSFDMMNEKQDIALNFRGCVRKDNWLYFANMEFNGLFRMSLETYEIAHEHTFACANLNSFFYVGQHVMSYQDNLIFFPNNNGQHNKLYCYNLKSREATEIDFPWNVGTSMRNCFAFVWGNRGWVIPADMSFGCYVMDLDTLQIERDKDLSGLLKNYRAGTRAVRQDETTFSFVDLDKNELLIVDVDAVTCQSYELPVQNVNMAAKTGGTVWITVNDTPDVYEWDMEQDALTKYVLNDPSLWNHSGSPYIDLIYIEEKNCVYLLGGTIGHILKTNRDLHTIDIAFDLPENFRFVKNKLNNYAFFGDAERVKDEVWFYPTEGNGILVYSMKEDTVRSIKCSVPVEDIPQNEEILLCELKECVNERDEGIYSTRRLIELMADRWKCTIKLPGEK